MAQGIKHAFLGQNCGPCMVDVISTLTQALTSDTYSLPVHKVSWIKNIAVLL